MHLLVCELNLMNASIWDTVKYLYSEYEFMTGNTGLDGGYATK